MNHENTLLTKPLTEAESEKIDKKNNKKTIEKLFEVIENIPMEGIVFHGTTRGKAEKIISEGFKGGINKDEEYYLEKEFLGLSESDNFGFTFTPEEKSDILELKNKIDALKDNDRTKESIRNIFNHIIKEMLLSLRASIIRSSQYGNDKFRTGFNLMDMYNGNVNRDIIPSIIVFRTPKNVDGYTSSGAENVELNYRKKWETIETPFNTIKFPDQKVMVEGVINLDNEDIEKIKNLSDTKAKKKHSRRKFEEVIESEMERLFVNKTVDFLYQKYRR